MQSRQEIRPSLRNACKVTLLPVSAALLVMTVTALLFAAAGRGGGGSVGASPTIGKLAYPGKVVTSLPFTRADFRGYADTFRLQLPQGRNPREFRVVFYDNAGNLQAGVDVALFNTWEEAQRAVLADASRSTISYTVTPTDSQLGIGDLVLLAWDGPVQNAATADEGLLRAVSFTRNNVGVISSFQNAAEPGDFVKLIRAMDRKLVAALVNAPAPQRRDYERDMRRESREETREDEEEEEEEEDD